MTERFNLKRSLTELCEKNDSFPEELFNHYYPRLFNFSKSFLKVEDGIDDILQEVFVRIWQGRKSITIPDTFNSYVFTITRNLLLNELRRRLNNKSLKEEVCKLSVTSEYSLVEQIEYHDLKDKVDKAVDELPDRQKEIFILSRNEGLAHKEIADKLKISTKTVEYHIALALKFLRHKLEGVELVSLLYFFLLF